VFTTLLYPFRCSICGDLILEKTDIPLCTLCSTALDPIGDRVCEKCGRPLISEDVVCMYCRSRTYLFTRNRSIYEYQEPVSTLIGRYKFQGKKALALFFASQLAAMLRKHTPPDIIIPVPGNPKSRRNRGWDQVDEIARILEKKYAFSVKRILIRKASQQQKTLNYASRSENLREKIRLKTGVFSGSSNENIVLLDDIFTTGATVNECTRTLIESGYAAVSVITIAID
jgi:ComF family protein